MEDRTYYYYIDGKKIQNEEAMASALLDENILFLNNFHFLGHDNKTIQPKTLTLFVNVNDIFGPGSDAEEITCAELPILFGLWREMGDSGVIKWACLKRNIKPRRRMIEHLKKNKHWDEVLESLPEGCIC
jgi:hypothetical protein